MTQHHDETVTGLGQDASGSATITLDRADEVLEAVEVERTAGDGTSYDVVVSEDSAFGGGVGRVTESAGLDPSNDPAILDNSGEGFRNFSPTVDGRKVHVQVTANGGTDGTDDDFDIRVYVSGSNR